MHVYRVRLREKLIVFRVLPSVLSLDSESVKLWQDMAGGEPGADKRR